VLKLCEEKGIIVRLDLINYARDAIFSSFLSNVGDDRGNVELLRYAKKRLALYDGAERLIAVINNPDPAINLLYRPGTEGILRGYLASIGQRQRSGELPYILTKVPTRWDAALDGMNHSECVREYLEAVDQPWLEIKEAQTILKLLFDSANVLQIINVDGTNLSLDITGQTFANSVVQKNLPGSELFSAPLRFGVNGVIVAKGRFQYKDSGVIEDITLNFESGRIIGWDARKGKEALTQILARDSGKGDGTRYVGEIGIGTNPHLRRHTINPLLVEKTGGSFHIAIGSCYDYTSYDGDPVSLQNGNKSSSDVHWDLTTILRGKQGVMTLTFPDDSSQIVQRNGYWLINGCEVLNNGWGALSREKQPDWWRARYQNGYRD
jgi:aminopeptidase